MFRCTQHKYRILIRLYELRLFKTSTGADMAFSRFKKKFISFSNPRLRYSSMYFVPDRGKILKNNTFFMNNPLREFPYLLLSNTYEA